MTKPSQIKKIIPIKRIIFCTIIVLSSFLFSCTDTCNKKLGDSFEAVEFAGLDTLSNQRLAINFDISTLSDLPETYFTEAILFDAIDIVDESRVDSFFVTTQKIRLLLQAIELPRINESKAYQFQLHFGDRRRFIDCKHPGMNDSYQLDLVFDIANENEIYEFSNFAWQEFFSAGAL